MIFQCVIRQTLQDCPSVIPYVDDILIFNKTKKEHDRSLEKSLHCLHTKNFQLQVSKCNFQKSEVPFLGRILSGTQFHIGLKMVPAIVEGHEPMTGTEVHSYMSLVNYCSEFIPDLVTVAEPIRALNRNRK